MTFSPTLVNFEKDNNLTEYGLIMPPWLIKLNGQGA